jgi:hypothetical protein
MALSIKIEKAPQFHWVAGGFEVAFCNVADQTEALLRRYWLKFLQRFSRYLRNINGFEPVCIRVQGLRRPLQLIRIPWLTAICSTAIACSSCGTSHRRIPNHVRSGRLA